jgi:hypothetical protein
MTYNPNVPLTGQSLNETRDPIKNNFTVIDNDFQQDHVAFNESGAGKHNQCIFPQVSSNGPATSANENAIYSKDVGGEPHLFWRPESQAAGGDEYQLTLASTANTATFATNTTYTGSNNGGWTFLPGGLILMYGSLDISVTGANGGSGSVTYPFAFPSGNGPFSISTSITNPALTIRLSGTTSDTGFSASLTASSNGTSTIIWMAIGN